MDPDVQDMYAGSGAGFNRGLLVPIEAKIRSLAIQLLYEVCRVQKFSFADLRGCLLLLCCIKLISCTGIFQDSFIDHLFDLVEQTRNIHDESFNYSVIKLIVSVRVL